MQVMHLDSTVYIYKFLFLVVTNEKNTQAVNKAAFLFLINKNYWRYTLKTIFEYLITKNKHHNYVDILVENFPDNINFDKESLKREFKTIIDMGYVPLSLEPFCDKVDIEACFYLFKKPEYKDNYVLTFIGHRFYDSTRDDALVLSYTSKKRNIECDETSVPVLMSWKSGHGDKIFNMQDGVMNYFAYFGDKPFREFWDEIKDKKWWAIGKFFMKSSQKHQKSIYNVESFFK